MEGNARYKRLVDNDCVPFSEKIKNKIEKIQGGNF